MKKLNYVIIAIVFALVFQACSDDKEPVIKISSFTYSTDSYVVFNTTGGESIKPELLPVDASVSYHIESISKDDVLFENSNSTFEVNNEGIVHVNESLETGIYIVTVKAVNTGDDDDLKTASLNFTITELMDLTSVAYDNNSYNLEINKALTIPTPLIEPQGIPLTNDLTITKDDITIETDKVQINADGSISIAADNALEEGVYQMQVKSVYEYDEMDFIISDIELVIYEPLISFGYEESSYTISEFKSWESGEPSVNPASIKVTFAILEVKKDGNKLTNHEFEINRLGEMSLKPGNNMGLGQYVVTCKVISEENEDNFLTTDVNVEIKIIIEGFKYDNTSYFIYDEQLNKKGVVTNAPIIDGENWKFSIESCNRWDGALESPQNNDYWEAFLSIDEETGIITVDANHNLSDKVHSVNVKAENEGQSFSTIAWLLSSNPLLIKLDWLEYPIMGGQPLKEGEGITYSIVELIPTNMPNGKYEIIGFHTFYGRYSDPQKRHEILEYLDWEEYNISIDEITGKFILPSGHTLPLRYESQDDRYPGMQLATYTVTIKYTYSNGLENYKSFAFEMKP